MTMFKDLEVWQTFDWINDAKPTENSFFRPCRKVSKHRYCTCDDAPVRDYRVGRISAKVYHVDKYKS